MSKFALKSAFLLLVSLFVFSLAVRDVSAATVVSPANMNGWAFQIQSPDGSGTFVSGPSTPPLGAGSGRLFTGTNGNNPTSIHTTAFANTKLSDVTRLEYSSFSQSTGGTASLYPMVVVNVSTGLGPDILTFDPHDQTIQTPVIGVWQNWNVKDGFVRSTSFAGFSGGTFSQYLAFIANFDSSDVLIVNRGDGTGGIRVQNPGTGSGDVHDENVDNFTIGINGSDTTYDFEPTTATNTYSRQFYSDNNFQNPAGSPTTVFSNPMNNDWGFGSPAPGVPADNFSATWEGTFDFESAKYRFLANTGNKNDIARIYLDGNLVVEKTSADPLVVDGALVNVSAGVHTVRVEYVHLAGRASLKFSYWKTSECRDLNADGKVNSGDQLVMANYYGAFPSFVDMNDDNSTNSGDQLLLAQRFNQVCPY